ncbi:hypothetical protein B0O99DRAFT_607052 [Bisporella sp. PMI_857]|nr:hypothetical protein B0O99DRAFT_607052 [Bisporella sp. PMI_857]
MVKVLSQTPMSKLSGSYAPYVSIYSVLQCLSIRHSQFACLQAPTWIRTGCCSELTRKSPPPSPFPSLSALAKPPLIPQTARVHIPIFFRSTAYIDLPIWKSRSPRVCHVILIILHHMWPSQLLAVPVPCRTFGPFSVYQRPASKHYLGPS